MDMRCELSIDGETKCSYMKDREQEEKAGQHGGESEEQYAAMVTSEHIDIRRLECGRRRESGEAKQGSVRYVICLHK